MAENGQDGVLDRPELFRRGLAELLGTFGLTFAGGGAIMVNAISGGQVTHVGVALTFGLIVAAMIYATGHISGAHINPAVTLAFATARHFPWKRVPAYWAAQLLGAGLAAGALRLLFGNVASLGTTLPLDGAAVQSLGLEIILTAILMFVIMAVATDTRAVGQAAAIAIGATVGLEAMFGGPISGASMNPARSLGPALMSGAFDHQWVYIAGPVAGALIGAVLYQTVRGGKPRAGERSVSDAGAQAESTGASRHDGTA